MDQKPDTKPGNYYVTCVDGGRVAWLAGPFPNDHATALGYVDRAREIAVELMPRLSFAMFGTARRELDAPAPIGKLNDQLGIAA